MMYREVIINENIQANPPVAKYQNGRINTGHHPFSVFRCLETKEEKQQLQQNAQRVEEEEAVFCLKVKNC